MKSRGKGDFFVGLLRDWKHGSNQSNSVAEENIYSTVEEYGTPKDTTLKLILWYATIENKPSANLYKREK